MTGWRVAGAWVCLLSVLWFGGLDVTHRHNDVNSSQDANASLPCQVCQLAASARPVAAPPQAAVPLLFTFARLVLPPPVAVIALPDRRAHFIRPPPASL